MTLEQKREIVKRFKNGENMAAIALKLTNYCAEHTIDQIVIVDRVIRDYMNKKFSLTPKKGRR